jgi:hypothetical protein
LLAGQPLGLRPQSEQLGQKRSILAFQHIPRARFEVIALRCHSFAPALAASSGREDRRH